MTDHDTTDSVSRRDVLTTAGGLAVGSTALAGLGTGRAAAGTDDGLRIELRERTEEYVAIDVRFPNDVFDGVEFPNDVFLGLADEFVLRDDAVSLPEDTERLATPVEVKPIETDSETYRRRLAYFRTQDVVGYSVPDVTLGLGLFPERTVPRYQWDTCPGHRDY
jgi:hypothetical protein